jgi:hypothetical protein
MTRQVAKPPYAPPPREPGFPPPARPPRPDSRGKASLVEPPTQRLGEACGWDDGWLCCLAMRRILRTAAPGPQAPLLAAAILGTGFLSDRLGTGLQGQARIQEFGGMAGKAAHPTTSRDQEPSPAGLC